MDILDQYVIKYPNSQNILDIFDGEWSSAMPDESLQAKPGFASLFNDARVTWATSVLGSFKNLSILELGPLEGGHSYMLQNMEAKEILAIEANTKAFLKCLCVKEIFDLHKVNFLLGDFASFLEENTSFFDIIFASGVLYHMKDPVQLLDLIARNCQKVFIWTHYYDNDVIINNPHLAHKFSEVQNFEYNGISYQAVEQQYKEALNWQGFCGGSNPDSRWLTKDSLVICLQAFGFNDITFGFEHPDHQHGPSLALCAIK